MTWQFSSDLGHDPKTHDDAVCLGLVAAAAMVAFFIFEKVFTLHIIEIWNTWIQYTGNQTGDF